MDLKIHFLSQSKSMEIFAFTKANIDFIHHATLDSCLSRIQGRPYWIVIDRICYHIHTNPEFILYKNRPVPIEYQSVFQSFLHITNVSKPLYAISAYSHSDLCTMVTSLQYPCGTKSVMYAKMKAEIALHEEVVKKLIRL